MSPRAAWRLESLGFTDVADYVAGEADWFAFGLPRAGREATVPRAGDVARRDVPTCQPRERIGEVRGRVRAAGWDTCLVVNGEGVVLGRLRGSAFDADPETSAEQVMAGGPTTFRPDVRLSEVAARMQAKHVGSVVVTTPDGRLVGAVAYEDAVRRLDASGAPDDR